MPILLTLLVQSAALLTCPHPQVHDGDSIRCAGGVRLRLAGIDAPELPGSPRCGRRPRPGTDCDAAAARRSRDRLARLVAAGPLVCRRAGVDRYGRQLVTHCRAGGVDLEKAMLAGGYARRWR